MKLNYKQYCILTYIVLHPKLSVVLKKYKTDFSGLQDMLPIGALQLDNYSDDSIASIVLRKEARLAREDYIRNSITVKIAISVIAAAVGSLISWLFST